MQRDLHALLNQQFRVRARVLVHVVHHATYLRRAFSLPLTISHARNVRVRQVHGVAVRTVHHHLLLAILLEQVLLAQVQHVSQ